LLFKQKRKLLVGKSFYLAQHGAIGINDYHMHNETATSQITL